MLRAPILLLILFNVFHLFSCVEHSDWIYDRETRRLNTTLANGTTYSCKPSDFNKQVWDFVKSNDQPCLPGTGDSVNDTSCVRMDVIRIMDEAMRFVDIADGCVVYPVPTEEEIFEKVEKIYRSSSLDDNLIPQEWYVQVAENITRMRTEYTNSTAALKEVELARQNSVVVLFNHRVKLPELRERVFDLQQELELAKQAEEMSRKEIAVDIKQLDDWRENLVGTEILALKDTYETELYVWKLLAEQRFSFVKMVSTKKNIEHEMTAFAQKVEKAKMSVLSAMAEANAIVAHAEYAQREVEYHSELARNYATGTYADDEEGIVMETESPLSTE